MRGVNKMNCIKKFFGFTFQRRFNRMLRKNGFNEVVLAFTPVNKVERRVKNMKNRIKMDDCKIVYTYIC